MVNKKNKLMTGILGLLMAGTIGTANAYDLTRTDYEPSRLEHIIEKRSTELITPQCGHTYCCQWCHQEAISDAENDSRSQEPHPRNPSSGNQHAQSGSHRGRPEADL